MLTKTFHDVYYSCKNCPVKEYCGTMIQSIRLCKSYKEIYYMSLNSL